MTCCGIQTVGGAPAGSGAAAVPTLEQQGVLLRVIDPAAPTGSTDALVLRFTAAPLQIGAVPIAQWVTITTDLVLGTVATIIEPGVYSCLLYVPWSAGIDVGDYVTLDAPAALRQTVVPEPDDPTVRNAQLVNASAAVAESLTITIPIVVDSTMISAGENTIRFQAAQIGAYPAATAPAAGDFLLPGTSCARIDKIGEAA